MSNASSPDNAVLTNTLVGRRSPLITLRFIGLSSTTSISASGAINCGTYTSSEESLAFSLNTPIGVSSMMVWSTLSMNSEPSVYVLSHVRSPFISSESFLDMSSPRPVPCIALFFFSSSLSYATKSLSISSSLIPIPVSLTENSIVAISFFLATIVTENDIPPSLVYFTAFVRRLSTTCLILATSPYKRFGRTSSITTSNINSFWLLLSLIIVAIERIASSGLYSCSTRCIFPDSNLDISSKSLTRLNRDSDAFLISLLLLTTLSA